MGAERLIEPLEINDLLLPNSMVFPAIQTNFATKNGFVTERLLRMYDKIAQGGSGFIITGAISVSDDGAVNTNMLRINRDIHTGNITLSCRISGDEFVEGGLTFNETRKIVRRLVEAGADVISVAAGTYASMNHLPPSTDMGEGVYVNLAGAIHDVIDAPVICCGNIRSLDCANNIIYKNKADLVAIGRPQIADPNFTKKLLNRQQVIECNDCGACLYFKTGAESMCCPKNPEL